MTTTMVRFKALLKNCAAFEHAVEIPMQVQHCLTATSRANVGSLSMFCPSV
jgi:hypothetical protein